MIAQLFLDLAQAVSECGNGISVRAAIVLRDNLERLRVDERGFGRRGTAVDTQYVLGIGIISAPPRWRIMHQIRGLGQRFECLENQHRTRSERLAFRQPGALASGQMRRTEGFEVWRLPGQNKVDPRPGLADEL